MQDKQLNKHNDAPVQFRNESTQYRGITDSVVAMARLASAGQSDSRVRDYATSIIREVYPKDYLSELAAIYYEVCRTQRYTRDPINHEFVQHPVVAMQTRATDCDDQATLLKSLICSLASACKSVGNDTQFMTVGFTKGASPLNQFSHVFLRVYHAKIGQYLVLDPVAGPTTNEMISRVKVARAYVE